MGDDRPGVPADDPVSLARPDDLVAALARHLGALHASTPVAGAVDVGLDAALAAAAERVAAGMIDAASFDAPYRGWSPERLLEVAARQADVARRPPPVPVHGDVRLGALRVDAGEIVRLDLPARVGDPYADLAHLAADLAVAVSPAAVPALFDAYGEERPDPLRIDLWVTLRQLLR